MKNISLLFIAFLFLQFSSFAQQGWIEQTSGTTEVLEGVSFTDSDNGTAVGENGTILRTTDGGAIWTLQTSGTTKWLYGVSFTDLDNGTAVGRDGTILRTIDGGTTWTSQSNGMSETLYGVSFSDSDNGTAVGRFGRIVRTTNGGITFVEEDEIEEIPTDYTLSQNYPNPFNPTTTIKYSIAKSGLIILALYNLVGEEVSVLVSGQLNAGFYEIEFDATRLPSGIYFYRLQAGNFVETKKMVLMK